ncbi:hypothetical protein ACFYT7_10180 [Streptomyces sp. NPDC004041]
MDAIGKLSTVGTAIVATGWRPDVKNWSAREACRSFCMSFPWIKE